MTKIIELTNQRTALSFGNKISIASSFAQRLVGLLGKCGLKEGEGLLIERCNQVHMLFMRFKIGIVFISSEDKVLEFVTELAPWRISKKVEGAVSVLELPVGVIERAQLQIGDVLKSN